MDSLETIMQGIRQERYKTNIRTVRLQEMHPLRDYHLIGLMLSYSSDQSDKQFRLNFDPAQEVLLRKMVSSEMIEKRLNVVDTDFFQAIISVDYYCTTITKDYSFVDKLYSFAKELERENQNLDPTISQISQHITEDYFKEHMDISNPDSQMRTMRRSYNSLKRETAVPENNPAAGVNPLYLEAGKTIASCIKELGAHVYSIESRQDLKALVFTDAIYCNIRSPRIRRSIEQELGNKDYLKASVIALQAATKQQYDSSFRRLLGLK